MEQDRSRWDTDAIAERRALLTRVLGAGPIGQYQVQASIAAVRDEAQPPLTPTGRRSSPSTTFSTG